MFFIIPCSWRRFYQAAALCGALAMATPCHAITPPPPGWTRVNLHITVTFYGNSQIYTALLLAKKTVLKGTISGPNMPACTVQPGSTDNYHQLSLTCTMPGIDVPGRQTYTGTLNLLTGKGHGNVVMTGEVLRESGRFTTQIFYPPS
jgi:hypothetical protein